MLLPVHNIAMLCGCVKVGQPQALTEVDPGAGCTSGIIAR